MMEHCSVFRDEQGLKQALDRIEELKKRCENLMVEDKSTAFNTELTEALELGSLIVLAEAILLSALGQNRKPRGPFPGRLSGAGRRQLAQTHPGHPRSGW